MQTPYPDIDPYSILFAFLAFHKCPQRAFLEMLNAQHAQAVRMAAVIAELLHAGQKRKTGEPFVTHPMATAWLLAQSGIRDETLLAAALLHDTQEDASDRVDSLSLRETYGVEPETVAVVELLTKRKDLPEAEYWRRIARSPEAIVVKLADRLHNLLTLEHAFPREKVLRKLAETRERVFALSGSDSLRKSPLRVTANNLFRVMALVCDALEPVHALSCVSAGRG